MRILLKYIISVQTFLFCFIGTLFPQNASHYGIESTKSIIYRAVAEDIGFVLEPIYLYLSDSSLFKYKIPFGFSYTKNDSIYVNSHMTTTGYYVKPGIGISSNNRVIPYINFLFSVYTIKNRYEIAGDYFDGYTGNYSHTNFAFGLEPSLDLKFTLYKELSLLMSFRFIFVLYNSKSSNEPLYYLPGAGITYNKKLTTAINFYLVW